MSKPKLKWCREGYDPHEKQAIMTELAKLDTVNIDAARLETTKIKAEPIGGEET